LTVTLREQNWIVPQTKPALPLEQTLDEIDEKGFSFIDTTALVSKMRAEGTFSVTLEAKHGLKRNCRHVTIFFLQTLSTLKKCDQQNLPTK